MSIVQPGPPVELVLRLRDELGLTTFVETGTYKGETAAWAARHFQRVVTFELSETLYRQAVEGNGALENVEFRLMDSRPGLAELVPTLEGPALFWLDGHWSGGTTYGAEDECALLDELGEITRSPHTHAVLIDDARLFESAPPRPHDPEQWPSIDQVLEYLLRSQERPAVAIVEDVIVAVPARARSLMVSYCQGLNTRAWERRWGTRLVRAKAALRTRALALSRLLRARRA